MIVGIRKMKRIKLDKIDRHIVSLLQAQGRMTNVDLAGKVGISAPPCLRRVKALEEAGIIQSYHANVNRSVFGYDVTIFANIRLEKQAEEDLLTFETRVQSMDRVRECHMIAGEVDFVLKIMAKSWDDYQDFRSKELTTAANVSSVKSSMVMRTAKEEFGIPIEVEGSVAA